MQIDPHEMIKAKRIWRWLKEGEKQPPFKIDLELHRRCNLRCLSCSRRASPDYERLNDISKKIEMLTEKWLEIVEEAARLGVREWHIAGGGEPMFLPERTVPVMEKIKEHGMLGIITTNGTLWTEEIVKKTVKIGWDRIHFSIDGPDELTHDFLRGRIGTFRRVVRTLELFNKYKKIYKSEKPMLCMNTVLSVMNYDKLPELVKFAHKMKIQYMFVEPLIVYSEFGRILKLKEEHLKIFPKFLEEAIKLAKKYGIDNNFAGIDRNLEEELIEKSSRMHEVVKKDVERMKEEGRDWIYTIPCYKPWFHMTIKCDGRTTSCDVPLEGGDNVKGKSLKEVWFGPYFETLRKELKQGRIPTFCSQCNPSHTTQRRRLRMYFEFIQKSLLQ